MDNESILVTIKKMIGLPEEYEQFDTDIITHINTTSVEGDETCSQRGDRYGHPGWRWTRRG